MTYHLIDKLSYAGNRELTLFANETTYDQRKD